MKPDSLQIAKDFKASIVVFLVALPLCLGIALASGAPVYSGIIAGVIGGIVVGFLSGSNLSVTGPAAGMTMIVLSSIENLGSFELFLVALFLAGIIQVGLGFLKVGVIGNFFPYSVIKGMIASIGIILVLKQLPHIVGYDEDFIGDNSFFQFDGHNTFSELFYAMQSLDATATIISLVSLGILILWDTKLFHKWKIAEFLPAAILVVVWGVVFNSIVGIVDPSLKLTGKHLVKIPVINDFQDFLSIFSYPDFSSWNHPEVFYAAILIAIVASLESLLSVEAVDRMDPERMTTPENRELFAQGIGNIASSLLGGIPITAVIIRSSANINAGAKTKLSAILHGFLLLISVFFLSKFLNLIPLSSLSAILLVVGYRLAKPSLFKESYEEGISQFIPFIVTVLAILFSNLLTGIIIGSVIGLFFVLKSNFGESISITKKDNNYLIRFNKDIFFLNKPELKRKLDSIPEGASVLFDGTKSKFIDHDILVLIKDFQLSAKNKNIDIEFKKTHYANYEMFKLTEKSE